MAVTHSDEEALTLLLIQPESTLAEMYRLKLELDGYDVQVASDRAQALGHLGAQLPDLIFLDVGTTNRAGWELLVQLRSDVRTTNIPVVILSGEPEDQLRARGWDLRAHEYLLRPPNVGGAGVMGQTARDSVPHVPVTAGSGRST
jgi:two-component system phosphate regulon response regulator PhoB